MPEAPAYRVHGQSQRVVEGAHALGERRPGLLLPLEPPKRLKFIAGIEFAAGVPLLTLRTCRVAVLKSTSSQRRSTSSAARRACLRATRIAGAFNAKALQALGIDPVEAQKRG
jgi:hypothetical protein